MSQKIDLLLLRALAEFRLATAPLLASQLETSEQMVRRRCRRLEGWNLVRVQSGRLGQGRGRPEWVYSLRVEGAQKLKQEGMVPTEVPLDCVTGERLDRTIEHQLLINWMSVHSRAIMKANRSLQVEFISSKSPFHLSSGGGSVLHDHVEFPNVRKMGFTPDAALCITHRGRGKSLLFFLEVDRGTESLAKGVGQSGHSDLRRKIVVYRNYLGRHGYRRYEQPTLFSSCFSGFRLLLITVTEQRRTVLCRLVRELPPSDFIWVASAAQIMQTRRFDLGWDRGGNVGHNKESILGSEGDACSVGLIKGEALR